jgi:hypothetical protein
LKNIKLPMELFRIVLPWESDRKTERPGATKKSILPLLAGTTVGVLVLPSGRVTVNTTVAVRGAVYDAE